MNNYFIVPGLGNSGDDHWQTHFEQSGSNFRRIEQKDWDAPDCDAWLSNIDDAIAAFDPATVVLIGHSLGCIAIAHWAAISGKRIKGALLVAPSDIEQPAYAFPMSGFTPIPLIPLPFKTIVVASNNDVWVSPERAAFFARQWGSEWLNIGDAGHINVAAGYGHWQEGLDLLQRFESV